MLNSEKFLLVTQSLHLTTCQGKSGNLEPWYNTPHHTLAEITQMMGNFGGDMTSYRLTPTLRQLNLVYHPRRQQPQLFLNPNQLSHLKPAHIHLITQPNSCLHKSYAALIIPLWQTSSEIEWGNVNLNIINEHLLLLLLIDRLFNYYS